MKVSILQQDLIGPIQAVSRSVGVRSNLPVLGNILLSTDGSKLKIAATNLEIGIIKLVKAEISEPGEITVPAKTILEIVSGLGASQIELESKEDVLSISSGKFSASINGISASEFPAIPLSSDKGISFEKEVLVQSSQILFAAAVDEGRPILTGILTEAKAGKLDFVATDGFRLAHRTVKLPEATHFKSLIPRRTFEEVVRVIGEEELDQVSVSTSENQNQIIFQIGATTLSSRLIEGNFPAWEKIVPTEITSRAIVEKADLLGAVKLASVFAKNEANIVTFDITKDKFALKSQAKELGSQENEVEAQIEGEGLQIAFNSKFLLDAVSAVPSLQLLIEFSGPLSPALIKPVGVEGLEYVIMPVRLS